MLSSLRHCIFVLLLAVVALGGPVHVALAAPPVAAEGKVAKVVVEGTRRIDEAAVLAAIGLRRGEQLNPQKIRRDLKAVHDTGWFLSLIHI